MTRVTILLYSFVGAFVGIIAALMLDGWLDKRFPPAQPVKHKYETPKAVV